MKHGRKCNLTNKMDRCIANKMPKRASLSKYLSLVVLLLHSSSWSVTAFSELLSISVNTFLLWTHFNIYLEKFKSKVICKFKQSQFQETWVQCQNMGVLNVLFGFLNASFWHFKLVIKIPNFGILNAKSFFL